MYSMNALGSRNLARYLSWLDEIWNEEKVGMYLCCIKIGILPNDKFSSYNGLIIITGF
jgi:hypothetical protein